MKICYDYQIFVAQRYGGISRYFYEIASRIAKLDGHSVNIIAPVYVNEYLKAGDLRVDGIYVPPVQRIGREVDIAIRVLANLLFKSPRRVDIIHETYYSMRDYKSRTDLRVITVYDMVHEKFPAQCSSTKLSRHVKAKAVGRADHVICISENTQKDLIEILGIEKEKTSVVYLGGSLFAKHSQVSRLVGGRPYLLYVGARRNYKNFETLLRAYGKSVRLRKEFDLYCFGGGKFSKPELELMSFLGLREDSVKHISGADEALAGLYASAAVFVYPSLYEGFGIPPLEAMSLDCPVVCANSGSLPEVVANGAEMFDPADEEAMRVAIERVVFSDDYRQELVNRGRFRSSFFSWDKCAQDTLTVYQKLLDNC